MTKLNEAQLTKLQDLRKAAIEGTGELVDTIADAVQCIQIVESALSDGLQFVEDLIKIATVQPIVTEIIRDATKAIQETGFDPDDGTEVALDIYNEITRRGPLGPVSKWVVNSFVLVGHGYEEIDDVVEKMQRLRGLITLYAKGGDIAKAIQ